MESLKIIKSITGDTPGKTVLLSKTDVLVLVAEVERLQAENTQLQTKQARLQVKFDNLIRFCLAAGLTPEWVEQ